VKNIHPTNFFFAALRLCGNSFVASKILVAAKTVPAKSQSRKEYKAKKAKQ
jgi:hypothetical protein